MVAFGYLSILLCNLCLDEAFRQYALPQLPGQSLDELLLAGRRFFIHLKEVEGINPDDHATIAFTDRFGHVLIALEELKA